jgi:group I intron endonuclease
MEDKFYIYKITSPSGKIYIGKTVNLKRRMGLYKTGHCKSQPALHRSLCKYGFNNHTIDILHELPADVAKSILSTYEILYISQYKECGYRLMNLTDGGEGLLGRKHSNETKKKMSEKSRANGIHPETRRKVIEYHTGRKMSDTQKEKISAALKGRKLSDTHIQKLRQRVGEKRSPDAIQNISRAHIGLTPWNKGKSGYKVGPYNKKELK